MTGMERALREAIKKAGGLSALAVATGMSKQRLHYMAHKSLRASPTAVLAIERATGVPRTKLRPDLYPAEAA